MKEFTEYNSLLEINYHSKRLDGKKDIDYWWDQRTMMKCFKVAGFKDMEFIKP